MTKPIRIAPFLFSLVATVLSPLGDVQAGRPVDLTSWIRALAPLLQVVARRAARCLPRGIRPGAIVGDDPRTSSGRVGMDRYIRLALSLFSLGNTVITTVYDVRAGRPVDVDAWIQTVAPLIGAGARGRRARRFPPPSAYR